MKKAFRLAAFALLAVFTTLSLAACGGDDDDDDKGGSKLEAQTFTVGGVTFMMMPVEGGKFMMGSPADDTEAEAYEMPQHEVELTSFYMGETEVTQALWKAVMDKKPSFFEGDNLPVEQVSWNDCQTFIAKLNEMTGKTFRLPTEAEWEYAARGGQKSKSKKYGSASNNVDTFWNADNSGDKTHAVGSNPNELGLCDMSGNVWEWCSDWYAYDYYASSPKKNPQGPATGTARVKRGGCWGSLAEVCRVANRAYDKPGYWDCTNGLRLAMSK